MKRRDALRVLGGAAAVPLVAGLAAEDLFGLGERIHARAAAGPVAGTRALDPHRRRTVELVAEMILPRTDTPGAIDAGVPDFIDLMVADWYDDEQRARFHEGLADLDRRARAAWGGTFVEGAEPDRTALLETLDTEVAALRETAGEAAQHHFFRMMKFLTLYGYYTSEAGATRELHYVPIPGEFHGCIPYLDPAHTS